MLKPSTQRIIWRLLMQMKRTSRAGFTLIEVLISIIISGLIVTVLLYLVVESLQLDRREVVLNQVQSDMQRALDYMAIDIKEAAFVYPDPNSIVDGEAVDEDGDPLARVTDLPDGKPILALWRITSIDSGDNLPGTATEEDEHPCDSFTSPADRQTCRRVRVRQGFHTLVVYVLADNDAGSIWEGQHRIIRYTLPEYTQGNIASLTVTPGFQDPNADSTPGNTNFEEWQRDPAAAATAGITAVLVDRIAEDPEPGAGEPDFCGIRTGTASLGSDDSYFRTVPPEGEGGVSVCVREPRDTDPSGNLEEGARRVRQDVYLSLRGDAVAGQEFINPQSDASRFPVIATQVQVRGLVDRRAR